MARPKGIQKTGGRQRGVPNKMTADIRAMILGALNQAGGQKYLLEQCRENPTAFMALLGKILPTQLEGGLSVSLTVVTGVPEAHQ